jgi:hypothetical protein
VDDTIKKNIHQLQSKYHVLISNELATCLNKNTFTKHNVMQLYGNLLYQPSISDSVSMLIINGILKNGTIINLINLHLASNLNQKSSSIDIIKKYLLHDPIASMQHSRVIIAGDMNISHDYDLFTNNQLLRMSKVKDNINFMKNYTKNDIKYNTSFSFGVCDGSVMKYKEFDEQMHKMNDQIYTSNNIIVEKINVYDDFDMGTYKLKISNTFSSYGPPFCLNDATKKLRDCELKPYKEIYNKNTNQKWPSDHTLVEGIFIINEQKGGKQTNANYYDKYQKYKLKYLMLRK